MKLFSENKTPTGKTTCNEGRSLRFAESRNKPHAGHALRSEGSEVCWKQGPHVRRILCSEPSLLAGREEQARHAWVLPALPPCLHQGEEQLPLQNGFLGDMYATDTTRDWTAPGPEAGGAGQSMASARDGPRGSALLPKVPPRLWVPLSRHPFQGVRQPAA